MDESRSVAPGIVHSRSGREARITRRANRRFVQVLVALGGMAALSWEVMWQIQASLALGVSALGTALTLAATMAGMTAGSLAAGRWLRAHTPERPLRLYGLLEAAIGSAGLIMLPGFRALEWLDGRLYSVSPVAAPCLHVVGIVALLGIPTFAMGATVPVFELVARRHATRVSSLYGLNTAGAALGVLLFSFVVLPGLGLSSTCLVVAGLNLLVFLAAQLLPEVHDDAAGARAPAQASGFLERRALVTASWVVFGTGFATFGLEVAWFRSLRAAFQSTTDSFAIILASVLVPLAIGARVTPTLRAKGIRPGLPLGVAACATLIATPLVERMDLFVSLNGSYWQLIATWLGLSLAILGPPMLFIGMALPWYLEEFSHPSDAGRLYALNTLGAVSGSLISAWVLLPEIGFARAAWVIGAGIAGLAWLAGESRQRTGVVLASAVALGIAVTQTASVGRDRFVSAQPYPGHRIIAYDEGPDSTVSVIEGPGGVRRLLIDGFGATTDQPGGSHYMQWMGHLPMLLHPQPRSALVICFGTGQTANAVRVEGPDRLDVVELDPSVFEMAALFPSSHGVLDDPRVHPVVMDGRAWIRRSARRYDVVTLEPMPPYFAGVNALYSREFYELVAERLAPGGIVAQWLPIHLLTHAYAASVLATLREVFPDAVLWTDPISRTGIVLGRAASDAQPLGEAWPGFERHEIERSLTESQIRRSLTLDPEGVARFAADAPIITDDNQLLAYGNVRKGLAEGRWRKEVGETLRSITEISGRPIYRIPPPRKPHRSRRGGS